MAFHSHCYEKPVGNFSNICGEILSLRTVSNVINIVPIATWYFVLVKFELS